ncbi:MAG: AAA family ATPase [Mycobacterium sp.]|uniref:AAA family ATPase n=1 Tax=Mycobacterium sp. TaxID=1785 RepID=UPI003F9C96C9
MRADEKVGPQSANPGETDNTDHYQTTAATSQSNGNGHQSASPEADVRQFFDVLYGGGAGFCHVAYGKDLYRDGDKPPRFRFWSETHERHAFAYPANAGAAAAKVLELSAAGADVYVSTSLMRTGASREKTQTAELWCLHADIDHAVNLDTLADQGWCAIASGTSGHCHLYIPLSEPITEQQFGALQNPLVELVNGDAKKAGNDVLRPPCTYNFKPTVGGGEPVPVTWAVRPTGRRHHPRTLAAQAGVDFDRPGPPPSGGAQANGGAKAKKTGERAKAATNGEAPDSDLHPKVLKALRLVTTNPPDRSVDAYRILCACVDDGLTLAQDGWALRRRDDLAEWLDGNPAGELERTWLKITQRRAEKEDDGAQPDPAMTGAAFILDAPTKVPALWGQESEVLWPEGEGLMIAGVIGLGKTTLAGQLVHAQLFGGDVLGLPVRKIEGRILYLAMDRPRQIARSLRRQFSEEDRAVVSKQLVVRPGPPPKDLAKAPGMLLEMAEQYDADYVYVDSLKDAAIGLSEDEVGAAYNRGRQLLLASGRNICELHHPIKMKGKSPSSIDDVYGSTWLTAGCGSVILLISNPGDLVFKLLHVKPCVDKVGPFQLQQNRDAGQITLFESIDLVKLAEADLLKGVTARAVAIVLNETTKPTPAQIESARYKLDKLVGKGMLSRVDGHKGGSAARWLRA